MSQYEDTDLCVLKICHRGGTLFGKDAFELLLSVDQGYKIRSKQAVND